MGAFAPLRHPWYRRLFATGTLFYLATWMQTVAVTWTMTTLTGSAFWVGSISTAVSLPMFILALPAGVLADVADRRSLMLATQATMLTAMGLLGAGSYFESLTPGLLLMLTALMGTAAAMHAPAWSATVGEAVPHEELSQALTLNGMSFNAARTVGPALAGALIAASGPPVIFGINAVVYLAVIAVLIGWRQRERASTLPPERLWGGVRSALRYFRHAPRLRGYLLRLAFFMLGGSSILSLVPIVAQTELQMGASGFGLLMGAFGAGGVVGAFTVQWFRRRLDPNAYITLSSIVLALVLLDIGFARWSSMLFVGLFLGGAFWMNAITEIFAAISSSVPTWMRGRSTAFHLLTTQGALAVGGVLWGSVAQVFGLQAAFSCSALTVIGGLALMGRYPIRMGEDTDILPGRVDELPQVLEQPEPDAGPVAVEIVYRVDPTHQDRFMDIAQRLGRVRRRNGASTWRLYRDLEESDRLLERFLVPSWIEFERQRSRWTHADSVLEESVRSFQKPGIRILTSHFVAER